MATLSRYSFVNFSTLTIESIRQESEIRIDSLGCDWNRATLFGRDICFEKKNIYYLTAKADLVLRETFLPKLGWTEILSKLFGR